jgi:hypothetical protein
MTFEFSYGSRYASEAPPWGPIPPKNKRPRGMPIPEMPKTGGPPAYVSEHKPSHSELELAKWKQRDSSQGLSRLDANAREPWTTARTKDALASQPATSVMETEKLDDGTFQRRQGHDPRQPQPSTIGERSGAVVSEAGTQEQSSQQITGHQGTETHDCATGKRSKK